MSNLYILIGIPCSGKSTLAVKMSKENPNLRVVSSDSLRRQLNFPVNKVFNRILFQEVETRLKFFLSKGYDVVLDATNLEEYYRKNLIELGRSYGAAIIAMVVNTDYQVCIDRNSRRNQMDSVPSNVMFSMQKKFSETIGNLKGFDKVEFISSHSDKKPISSTKKVIQFIPRT